MSTKNKKIYETFIFSIENEGFEYAIENYSDDISKIEPELLLEIEGYRKHKQDLINKIMSILEGKVCDKVISKKALETIKFLQ